MGFFDDFRKAIDDYTDENVTIDVVDFQEPGNHIDETEVCSFKVRVRNDGQLDLRSVVLHVAGFAPWSSVSPTQNSFRTDFYTEQKDIDAHNWATYGTYYMRADTATPTLTNVWPLLSIKIGSFDADLHHLLVDHTKYESSPTEHYRRHIHPGPR